MFFNYIKMICPDYSQASFFIFAEGVPDLLYYSHLSAILISIFVGSFVFMKDRSNFASRVLFLLSLCFSFWTFINLIVWTNNSSGLIMFVWSFFGILYALICVLSLYFIYAFIDKKGPSFLVKLVLGLLFLPIVIFAPTDAHLTLFNVPLCGVTEEGFIYTNYYYIFGFLMFLWALYILISRYRVVPDMQKRQVLMLGVGIELFLFSFFLTGYIPSLLADNFFALEFYGLFGMTFFMGMLAYIIVKFKAFDIKLIGAQALVVALWFLVGSLLFVAQSTTTRTVAGVTLLFTTIAGYYLVRSVKKEVKQREQLEELTEQLEKANDRLKILDKMKSEFVSIASHQLRSPLTSIRGYASMLAEGSYGKIPEKAQEALNNIVDSSKFMAMSIEDYLNVSRIEAGNMKYEMSDFNLKDITEKIVDEMRPTAMKKGLVIVFRSDCSGSASINADIGKTRQVIMNLIDNSMKYTPKGTITVVAHDDIKKKKMYITIQDTGIGMSKETQEEVFDKFVRAKNANSVNVTGTGLGLFVAKKMVDEMKGKVWAESEGEGKGSTFHIEFPLLPGNTTAR
jgi:signal transduction histidine kinase